MDVIKDLTLWSWAFRAFVMLIGLAVMVMGFYLFRGRRSYEPAGSSAHHGGSRVTVRGAAGTFFVLVGAAVMLAGLLKPIRFDYSRFLPGSREQASSAPAHAPPNSSNYIVADSLGGYESTESNSYPAPDSTTDSGSVYRK